MLCFELDLTYIFLSALFKASQYCIYSVYLQNNCLGYPQKQIFWIVDWGFYLPPSPSTLTPGLGRYLMYWTFFKMPSSTTKCLLFSLPNTNKLTTPWHPMRQRPPPLPDLTIFCSFCLAIRFIIWNSFDLLHSFSIASLRPSLTSSLTSPFRNSIHSHSIRLVHITPTTLRAVYQPEPISIQIRSEIPMPIQNLH